MELKKMISYIFLLLFPMLSIAQEYGEIKYGVEMKHNPIKNEDPSDYTKSNLYKRFESFKTIAPSLNYYLKFDENSAVFYPSKDLNSDNKKVNIELGYILSDSQNTYYTDYQKYYKQSEIKSKYYLVKQDSIEWNIIADKKKRIANFDCIKATAEISHNDRSITEITAWFTPEISISFGPKGYGDLPGLILAIEDLGFYFYAKEINFKKEPEVIQKPQGQIIDAEVYKNKIKSNGFRSY